MTVDQAIQFPTDTVPLCLRQLAQWVCWRYVERDGKQTKCPFNAKTGAMADSTDPRTWSTFDAALAAWQQNSEYEGIGFVFAEDDPYAGVDLDECIGAEDHLVPAAQAIVDAFSSYTEISPSGQGVKIFIRGAKPPWAKCKSKAIAGYKETEIYDQERFFTVTGRNLPGTPLTIEDRQQALLDLCQRLWPQRPTQAPAAPAGGGFNGDDDELIQRASRSKNGDRFKRLFAGDTSLHGGDDSSADLALCNMLAFWTGRNAERMDRLFRRSGLMRPKWDERHGEKKYGQMTIDKALEQVTDCYQPRLRAGSNGSPAAGAGRHDGDDGDGDDDGPIPLGQREPKTNRLVLSLRRTLPTAQAFVVVFHRHPEGRTLHSYAGTLLVWRGNRFVEIEDETLRQKLLPWLHDALRYLINKKTGALELVDFESNPTTVKAGIESIRAFAHLPANITPPVWLPGPDGRPDPRELLPCLSGNLHITSGAMLAPTPALFNINALDYDYNPNAEVPERWIKFLEQLWEDDLESVALLQEWMGYCLVADTSQQKMLLLVGPRRSGKGTIGRVLTRLVGAGNVVGPTTSSLAGTFGLQPLIGKSLAIVSDARFTGDSVGIVVERLLCISGEDTLTVDRKFLGSVTMKLPTRFMFLTNELPRMNDTSAALAGRFVVLRLVRSFYGQEDPALTSTLMEELPGILLWAIEGLKRLRARGHFVQPASVSEAVREMEDLASPVLAFTRDCCFVAAGQRVWVDDLYLGWKSWCERDGRTIVTNKQTFGRDLAAAVPGVVRRRGAGDVPFYDGISLKEATT